jgi:hypothetical protein
VRWASGVGGVIAAGVLAAGLAACGSPAATARLPAAARAGATAVPVRVQLNAVGWSGMTVRPDHIYVGMGGAPVVRRLTWRNWGGAQAWAAGQLDLYFPQPGPISSWHPTVYPVRVRLRDIVAHDGQPSYRKMAYSYVTRHGVTKVLYFTFSVLPGGSMPSWNQPGAGPSRGSTPGLA